MKQKFYDMTNLLKCEAQYNILLGERSNGKSYQVKHYCIKRFLYDNEMFVYLRRFTVENKNMMVNAYFGDVDIKKLSKGKFDAIDIWRGEIWLCIYDEKNKLIRDTKCGLVMSLSISSHYKSMSLLSIKNIIFEEFITDDLYLPNEPNRLQQLISTIARRNEICVFLIGNTISRLCPYFNEWQLVNIPKQKQGTIDLYRMKTEQIDEKGERIIITIAVEVCENSGKNGKMFFGNVASAINEGAWETDVHPHMEYDYKECKSLYGITFSKHNMIYIAEILRSPDDTMFIFVRPTKKVNTRRHITREYSDDFMITSKFVQITRGDKVFAQLLKLNNVCYSDNLTGTEFLTILKEGV